MNKIFYNINESNIFVEVGLLKFYFSSETLKNRFLREYNKYIEEEKIKLDTRYKMNIDKDFFIISLYRQIESRGERIYLNNKLVECLRNSIIYKTKE